MEIQHSTRRGCAVVAFGGTIDLASVATVQRTLLKELSEQPDALICDLAGVQHLDPMAAAVFSTVAKHPASRWPTTSFLLCGARPQVAEALRRVRASRLVRMYATVEEAVKAARARPPVVQDELRLELRADRLFIAVRDRGPKELQPVPPAPEVEGGRGLWLVEQLARAWGSALPPTAARPSGAPSPSDTSRSTPRKVPPAAGPWALTGRRRGEDGGVERNGALGVRRT